MARAKPPPRTDKQYALDFCNPAIKYGYGSHAILKRILLTVNICYWLIFVVQYCEGSVLSAKIKLSPVI
jgi:hypothetical protein